MRKAILKSYFIISFLIIVADNCYKKKNIFKVIRVR